eukprot:scpid7381/ scgid6137/ 
MHTYHCPAQVCSVGMCSPTRFSVNVSGLLCMYNHYQTSSVSIGSSAACSSRALNSSAVTDTCENGSASQFSMSTQCMEAGQFFRGAQELNGDDPASTEAAST